MSDRYYVFFVFDESWTETNLKEVVAYLDDGYSLNVPSVLETTDDIPSSTDTTPGDYVEMLTSGVGQLDVALPAGEASITVIPDADPDETTGAVTLPDFHFLVPEYCFDPKQHETDEDVLTRTETLYTLLGGLYDHLVEAGQSPLYVYGLSPEDQRRIAHSDYSVSVSSDRIEAREIPGIYWFQIIPPNIVTTVGLEALRSAPVYKSESLSDGALLFVLHQYPVKQVEPRDVADHLGITYDSPY